MKRGLTPFSREEKIGACQVMNISFSLSVLRATDFGSRHPEKLLME
jgi:hypothetical protein